MQVFDLRLGLMCLFCVLSCKDSPMVDEGDISKATTAVNEITKINKI